MSKTKRHLTEAEKKINRLRRKFENTVAYPEWVEWHSANEAFTSTPDGAVAYREHALEVLSNARHLPATPVYEDGYAYALSLLQNAKVLDDLVSLKRIAAPLHREAA